MGGLSSARNHCIVSMEHSDYTDRVAAEQRYIAWRAINALDEIAGELRALYWFLVIFACVFLYYYFHDEVKP